MRWFVLFLIPLLGHSQPLTIGDPAFVGVYPSGAVTPASVAGIRYWWRFEDNPTNVPVTNWLDRIQSFPLTNSNNSLRPTNSASGVGFNGSTWLSNTLSFAITCGAPGCHTYAAGTATNGSLWVLIVPQSTALAGVVTTTAAGGAGLFTAATRQFEWFSTGGNVIFDPSFTAGAAIDLGLSITNQHPPNCTFYTNGVLAASVVSSDDTTSNGQLNVGAYGPGSGTSPFNGLVLDVVYYTNYLQAADYATLHTYAKNRGVTP